MFGKDDVRDAAPADQRGPRQTDTASFDSARFREVLSLFPTSVTTVTACHASGQCLGLTLGSFTSVSLTPPLVAFFVDRKSGTWPKIREGGAFCVNLLASDQEDVCRAFAASGTDKFKGLTWHPAPSGAPVIDGVVAWIDCQIESVYETGDHFFVVGAVTSLDINRQSLPLLFFRKGYGSFLPLSFTSLESDILGRLRTVDLLRPIMEQVADELAAECVASVLVGSQLAYVAHVVGRNREGLTTHVGWRLPFRPPTGATFVAWGGQNDLDSWLAHLDPATAKAQQGHFLEVLAQIRHVGYAVGLGRETHAKVWNTFSRAPDETPPTDERVVDVVNNLWPGYEQEGLTAGRTYEVQTISAPVFGSNGQVIVQLTLVRLPGRSSKGDVEAAGRCLLRAARSATQQIGGILPDRFPDP